MEREEIWITMIRSEHADDAAIEGVYGSAEAAKEGLGRQPNMQAYIGDDGLVHGEPIRRRWPGEKPPAGWFPVRRAIGMPMMLRRYEGWRRPQGPSFTCPVCGMTSYHPEDVRRGYCGNCHDWTGMPKPAGVQ